MRSIWDITVVSVFRVHIFKKLYSESDSMYNSSPKSILRSATTPTIWRSFSFNALSRENIFSKDKLFSRGLYKQGNYRVLIWRNVETLVSKSFAVKKNCYLRYTSHLSRMIQQRLQNIERLYGKNLYNSGYDAITIQFSNLLLRRQLWVN